MKYLSILVVLIAVTGITFTFRNSSHNHAVASLSPERPEKVDRASGVDRRDPLAGKQQESKKETADIARCAVELKRVGAEITDLDLARIASECGDHLFEKARLSPDNKHLINQAVQHYRACLAHEPTCRDAGPLFRNAKVKIEHLERLLAQAGSGSSKAKPETSSPSTSPAETSKPVEPNVPLSEEGQQKDEAKMVGPDGVIYKRIKR